MQELTGLLGKLLGEDLAEYVIDNGVLFYPGYNYKPGNKQELKISVHTIKITDGDFKITVSYKSVPRFLRWVVPNSVEIPNGLNGQHRELAEVVGALLKEYGNCRHPKLDPLYIDPNRISEYIKRSSVLMKNQNLY